MADNPGIPKRVPCPACKAVSIYVRSLDRYVHEDGTDNRTCWLTISRGETNPATNTQPTTQHT